MREIAKSRAAIIFLNRDAVQAEDAHGRPEIDRKGIGAVDFGRARGDFGRREGAHRIAQNVEIGTGREIETVILHGCGPCAVPWTFCRVNWPVPYPLKHIWWQRLPGNSNLPANSRKSFSLAAARAIMGPDHEARITQNGHAADRSRPLPRACPM